MQLFKFNPVSSPTVLESGQTINGATSIMWVERYRESGEFEIVSPLSAGLKSFLPLGTLISHVDTLEVMIVENHEITENNSEDPILTTTGRSFDSYLENRIVGADGLRQFPDIYEVGVDIGTAANNAFMLIILVLTEPAHYDDRLTNVVVGYDHESATTGSPSVKPGPLDQRVRELLAIDDLGIKTIRRNNFENVLGSPDETLLWIYHGIDRTKEVIFSWTGGDLEEAQYLYTIKNLKTTACVMGKWVGVVVDKPGSEILYDRRFMMVDASDLDNQFNDMPAGSDLTTIVSKMTARGNEALRAQTGSTITQADVSNNSKYRYRIDFNVGDIVRLDGNYGEIANMRITEYTEIQDENGDSGHPTLQLPGV